MMTPLERLKHLKRRKTQNSEESENDNFEDADYSSIKFL